MGQDMNPGIHDLLIDRHVAHKSMLLQEHRTYNIMPNKDFNNAG